MRGSRFRWLRGVARSACDEAIHSCLVALDCFASLAMTACSALHTAPSSPGLTGDPVRRSSSAPSRELWNTGSPAGACHRVAIRPTRWRAMTGVHVRVLATPCARVLPIVSPRKQRRSAIPRGTRGKPGANCTRGLLCNEESTGVRNHRFNRIIRLSPRNGFNGFLRALLGDRACLPPSSTKMISRT